MHPVEHQAGQRHPLVAQPLGEIRGLPDRVRLRGRDQQERRLRVLQDPVRLLGALPEAAEHRVQRRDEAGQVGQQLRAEDLLHRPGEHPERGRDQAEHAPAAGSRRRQQQPQHPAVEEPGQPGRRVQEVQRRPRRRGVDHDQVPLALRRAAGPASPSPCIPACRRRSSSSPGRTGSRRSPPPAAGRCARAPPRRRCASCRASWRAARRRSPSVSMPLTCRGVLSSSVRPIDWASRRAGSMVSTTVRRPCCSAARSAERGGRGGLADAAGAAADDDRGRRVARAAPSTSSARRGRCIRAYRVMPERTDVAARSRQADMSGAASSSSPARSTPAGSSGSSIIGRPTSASSARSDSSSSRRVRWAFASACRPVTVAGSVGRPAAASPRLSSACGDLAGGQQRRPGAVDDDPARPGCAARSARRSRPGVSWTGISSSSVTTCTAVIGERSSDGDALALGLDRAHLGQPGGLGGHVEEPADPAGRRGVEHHRVVHPPAVVRCGWSPP